MVNQTVILVGISLRSHWPNSNNPNGLVRADYQAFLKALGHADKNVTVPCFPVVLHSAVFRPRARIADKGFAGFW